MVLFIEILFIFQHNEKDIAKKNKILFLLIILLPNLTFNLVKIEK